MRNITLCIIFFYNMQCLAQYDTDRWQVFNLQELIAKQVLNQKRYLPFLDQKSMTAGIYELKRGDEDQQQPHIQDEIYFILNGSSDFTVEDETTQVGPGDVLFVRATLDHKFSNIREDLKVLVWFSRATKTDHDFQWKKWSAKELTGAAKPNDNTWNPFVEVPTLITGLYSLPETVGGDSVLTHEIDEINYVVKGRASFETDGEVTEVAPGSIMWVKAGVGHRFYDLHGDLEVYIMFEQP